MTVKNAIMVKSQVVMMTMKITVEFVEHYMKKRPMKLRNGLIVMYVERGHY